MVVGVDEVGRGCLAGPVCVAAVALDAIIPGLKDSKKLSPLKRQAFARQIKYDARAIGIGWAPHSYIDQFGLTAALAWAAKKALLSTAQPIETVLLDGNHNYIGDPRVKTIINGDDLEPSISAASIIAKVARDAYMARISMLYPNYGFERHVGYGTVVHKAALFAHGPCALHRMSFLPLQGLSRVD